MKKKTVRKVASKKKSLTVKKGKAPKRAIKISVLLGQVFEGISSLSNEDSAKLTARIKAAILKARKA